MAKGNESTTKFKADISELKSAFQEAQRQVRLANSEFKAATAGMDKWSDSADGISAKLSQLNKVLDGENKKLKSLENQYALVAKEQGENSKGAQELAIKINNQKSVKGEKTKYKLAHSMKECMLTTSVENITVKQIVENCGLTRQTFYRNFLDKYDLINWYFDKLLL